MHQKIRPVTFLFVLLFTTSMAMAQKNPFSQAWGRQEVHAGYGWNTIQEMQALFADIFGDNTEAGGNGAFCLGYRYHLNNRWAAGISGTIENIQVTYKNSAGRYTCNTYSVMADIQYYYIQKPVLQIYSGVYAGYGSFKTNKAVNENYQTVAFHVTALGVRMGKLIGVFGEAGFGYRGVINIGISARL